MPKLKSLDDLKRVREEAQQALKTRLDTGTTVTVGMGTCGIAAGARDTMQAILAELAERNIDAHVTTVGCIGQCVKEPLVDIEQAGKPRITYANVRPDMVPRLIEEHLINNRPVDEWVIGRLETSQPETNVAPTHVAPTPVAPTPVAPTPGAAKD